MATEDFTTYTEVDPNGHITIVDADTIETNDIRRNETAYVYKDFGASYFGNFKCEFQVRFDDTDNTFIAHHFTLANALDDQQGLIDDEEPLLTIYTYNRDGDKEINILERGDDGSGYDYTRDLSDDHYSNNTWYYITAERYGSTWSMWIYSDASRTILLQVQTCSHPEETEFRYCYPMQSRNTGHNIAVDADTDKLEFLTPYDYSDAEDFTDAAWVSVDTGGGYIDQYTNRLWGVFDDDDELYVYKDYGAGYWGDYDVDYTIYMENMEDTALTMVVWFTNNLDDYAGQQTYVGSTLYDDDYKINLRECNNIDAATSDTYDGVKDVFYYLSQIRSGQTINLYIYSDEDRTDLLDTLTVTHEEETTFRYMIAMGNRDVNGAKESNCYLDNLIIQSGGTPDNGSNVYAYNGSNTIEFVRDDDSPLKLYDGAETIGLALVTPSHGSASAFMFYDGSDTLAIKEI